MNRDDSWFEHLYREWYPRVVRYFVRKGFTLEEARELAQDVFVRVYSRMDTFRGDSSPRTWLFRIVHNVWANEIRSRKAQSRQGHTVPLDSGSGEEDEVGLIGTIASPDPSPHEVLEANEAKRQLAAAIEALPARKRVVLLLQLDDLSYKEIADILGIKVETVKSLRHDALKTLKQTLRGPWSHLDESEEREGAREDESREDEPREDE